MTSTVKTLIPRKQAEAVQTQQYQAVSCTAIIDTFTATNTTSSPVPFSVNLVNPGGSAGVDNLIIKAKSIAPGECYRCPELVGQVLESGAFISTLAGSALAITISASGRQIT